MRTWPLRYHRWFERSFFFPPANEQRRPTITVLGMNAAAAEPATDRHQDGSRTHSAQVRINSRHLMNMALLAVLPMVAAPTLNYARTLMVDPDIWWHLANARLLLTTHHFIQTDPYAFTAIGQRWIDWEWLSEIPYWFCYQAFQLQGIYLMTWLVLAANMIFVYWRGYWMARSADASLWSAAIALILMTVNSGPRMIEFAYLAMSAELAIIEAADRGHKRLLWLLAPLFCLWINLHGTWLVGLGLLAVYIVSGLFPVNLGVFEQKAFTRADRIQLLSVFLASAIMLLVNPYGWRLIWQPFDMMFNQKLSVATIAEWQPLSLSSLEGRGVVVAVALMVVANCIRGRKWKIFELALVFFAWYTAIDHHRFTYLAAVITAPMLARDLSRTFSKDPDANTIPTMNFLMAAGALCAMLIFFPSEASLKKMLGMMFPVQTISTIQPSWRTYDWDYVGGMMAFESKPSFIDTRFDSFEHLGVMKDARSILAGQNAFELMDKYRVDHALVKDDAALADLLEHSTAWRLEKREKAWEGEYLMFAKVPATATGQ
jgi:hypothetical protein